MTTRIAKAATLSVVAVTVVLALLAYSAVLAPATAQTATNTSTASTATASTTHNLPPGGQGGPFGLPQQQGQGFGQGPARGNFQQNRVNVSVGQTITLTSTQGTYFVVGDAAQNGTASGTLTFSVTGSLATGDTLSLTGGSLVVNGNTYSIASGSAQMDPSATTISGQGTTTPIGAFIVQASAHGDFVSSSGIVSLDFKAGSTEYLVNLVTTVQG
ncbi:MAG: hypothetical protein OK456_07205 [Thaumarchaeota archaeon]|nr:hypothetical protein [Nitrososphaerota archaeon]